MARDGKVGGQGVEQPEITEPGGSGRSEGGGQEIGSEKIGGVDEDGDRATAAGAAAPGVRGAQVAA